MKSYFLWLAKFITVVLVVFVVIPVLGLAVISAAGQIMVKDLTPAKKNSVAVVELNGAIMTSKDIVEKLHDQVENKDVKGIVLRINSPGGAVGPSQDIYRAVERLKAKKPIVVSMGSVAASGGLYSAMAASKIFAQEGTLTGSIGVIMQLPNFKEIAHKVGFDMITIKSGKMKDAGNSFRDMKPEERAYLEDVAKRAHSDFIDAVAKGRNIPREKVEQFADGRILLGTDAKKLGLVDEFGDVYDAARAVFDLLGKPLKEDEEPNLLYPGDKFEEIKKILKSVSNLTSVAETRVSLEYRMY